jgi:hypothetical protein
MAKASITTSDVLAALAITDEAERKAAVKAANLALRTTVRSAVRSEDKARKQTGKSGALAYHLNYGPDAESQYDSKGAMALDYKVSASTVTKWKNLSLALFVKGIDEDSDLFMRDLNGSTLANKKEIAALLADDTSTAADIEAEVRKFVDEKGNKVAADNGGPGTRKTAKQVALALVETIGEKGKTMDYAEWQTVQAAIHKMIDAVEDHHVEVAAKAEAEALAESAAS